MLRPCALLALLLTTVPAVVPAQGVDDARAAVVNWSFGDTERHIDDYAWYIGNSGGEAHDVGTRKPNDWGLHDMHGNVWEWVADWKGTYSADPVEDPPGPSGGTNRVLRGGSFANGLRFLRSACRDGYPPEFRYWLEGFRCVRAPHRQP